MLTQLMNDSSRRCRIYLRRSLRRFDGDDQSGEVLAADLDEIADLGGSQLPALDALTQRPMGAVAEFDYFGEGEPLPLGEGPTDRLTVVNGL